MSFSIRKDGIFDPEGKYPNPLTGQPYSQSYKTLAMGKKGWTELTAWKARVDIIKKIHQNQILLLVLPTGVGKTVIVPKLLLHYFEYKKRVVVTVPRLPITSESGEYSAKCLDVPLYAVDNNGDDIFNPDSKNKEDTKYPTGNKLVGYKTSSVGNKFGDKNSVLLFTTDGNIKQAIVSGDKDLSNYGGIIIDEAHERSVNIDILIALVLDIIPRRPDFKVIIMSATIKKSTFTDYFKRIGLGDKYSTFDLPKVTTNFVIDFKKQLKSVNSNNLVDEIYKKINEIILDPKLEKGNILAFVTGEPDIIKIQRKIENNMNNYPVNNKPYTIGFNALISPDNKDIAVGKVKLEELKPTPNAPQGFSRKVIIATNAIESSITFKEPLKYVIDSGLAFEKKYDAKNYAYETGKTLVSQASIQQRCGRTGRNCDGMCIQLYTTDQFDKLSEFTTPKILVDEFTNELLNLSIINGNIPNAMKFMERMIEEPKNYKDSISRAYHNLLNMDLIDSAGNVTDLGFVCSKFNEIKIGKMIIGGYYLGCMNLCVMLGAIIIECESFEKMFRKPPNMDINPKLEKEYKNNIKRFINPYGDHISLLIVFNNYISIPESKRFEYAKDNGLEINTLGKIQKEYENLYKTVKQQIPYIKNLNLFNVPPEILIFGGGKNNENNENINKHIGGDSDDSGDSGDSGDSDDEFDTDLDDDFENEEKKLENHINKLNIKNTQNIQNIQNGGKLSEFHSDSDDSDDSGDSGDSDDDSGDSDDDIDDEIDDELDSDFDDEIENNIENNTEYNNININKNINESRNSKQNKTRIETGKENGNGNGNGTINNNHQGGFQSIDKNFYSNTNSNNRNSKIIRRLTNKNNGDNLQNKKTKKNMNGDMNGGSSKKDSSDDAKNKKRRKIMELLDIKNLQNIKIIPPSSVIDRILASLFYGYSNNIACKSGNGNKYYVKFSSKQGSIESTSFDFIKTIPEFVIYNEFSINKDMGSSGSKLSLVSEINTNHFGQFINIQDLKNKIKNL